MMGNSVVRSKQYPGRLVRGLALCMVHACATPASANPADLLLVNGKIITQDAAASVKEALAIEGDHIAATGHSEELRKLAGPSTKIIDLGGRTVIPGPVDSHIHAIRAGFRFATEVNWEGATSLTRSAGAPSVRGRSRQTGRLADRRRRMDAAPVCREPAADRGRDCGRRVRPSRLHPALLWLRADQCRRPRPARPSSLRADLPAGATFERDKEGNATGWIVGKGPAIISLYSLLPKPQMRDAIEGTRQFLRELSSFGLTGVIDPGGHNLAPEDYAALVPPVARARTAAARGLQHLRAASGNGA